MTLVIIIEPEGESFNLVEGPNPRQVSFPEGGWKTSYLPGATEASFESGNGLAQWLKTLAFFSLSTIDQTGLSFSRRPSPSQTWQQRCILIRALPRFVTASQPRIYIYIYIRPDCFIRNNGQENGRLINWTSREGTKGER